jgi:osmotically-inducible protein OsmY
MTTSAKLFRMATVAVGSFTLSYAGLVYAHQQPDNTANNKQAAPTADQQSQNPADREMAKKIRHSIMEDKNLSTYAHNIKVIVRDGSVTLKGPVKTADDKAAIEAKASAIAGVGKVENDLTIAQ